MSDTFVAGNRLRASDMVPQKIWTVSSTSDSSSINTTEAVISTIGTAPSTTYRAGRAYKLTARMRLQASAGALDAIFQVRDTNASGTIRMGPQLTRLPSFAASQYFHVLIETYVANTTTADITGRVLVLCGDASANSFVVDAEATFPCYWNCFEYGDADDFPEAIAL